MVNNFTQTAPKTAEGFAVTNGGRFAVWHSTGADGVDSQIASVATAQDFTGVAGAAYRISAADGTSAATIASGTPENVYVRFSGTGADGTTRDWLWKCANGYDLEVRFIQAGIISFKAVNGGAVKLFIRRLW